MFAHDTLRTPWHAFAHDTHQGLWGTTHHWTEAGAYHWSPPLVGQEGGAACPQATGRGAGATSHLVLSSVVSWFISCQEPLSRTATWRPDCRPVSSPIPTGADPSLLGRGLCKNLLAPAPSEYPSALGVIRWRNTCVSFDMSAPPRTLPVAPFHSRPHALQSSPNVVRPMPRNLPSLFLVLDGRCLRSHLLLYTGFCALAPTSK